MINRFMDEVVSKGAKNVLPQSLSQEWLDQVFVAAKNLLADIAAHNKLTPGSSEEILDDQESALMLAAVMELLHHKNQYSADLNVADISEEDLHECFLCYAMSIIMEVICREQEIEIEKPTLENIFDRTRVFEIEQNHPELTEELNKRVFEL